ncbi:hypothetical protein SAMN05443575_3091 [Jatrophihabitans endophyticus]|uniref:Uncharacterized protein n=1 Tax=Jatrophihabitans endophyticus TaxID=1206085 RepID=A0A1M5PHY9_9ACTN|nr:hypothetical protein [Jatrophihabitans endophyticus]SHH01434.1 hypothetical protein SAMN05443575_3091 [Jatrophihabitans endophyticus]
MSTAESTPDGAAATGGRPGVSGRNVVLVLLGGALVLAALGGLQWYTADGGGVNSAGTGFTFTDLHANATSLHAAVSGAYFDWLGWTVFVAAGVVALAANVPSPVTDVLRVAAFLLAVLGLVATYYALAQLFDAQRVAGGSTHSVVHNASFGFWAVFAGFALILLGGTLGARRG